MALDEQVFQVIDLQGNIETPMDSGGHLEITKSVWGARGREFESHRPDQ